MTLAYYSEFDPFCADWLLELIADGLIAPGIVDRRSIIDVLPSDLKGFNQCHFFAGIGVWSLSLRLAGFPDDRPIWTGSAPCQSFSAAGKGLGFADERHLWPAWFHLIECAKPANVPLIGEQVASKDGRAWFDLVSGDMEGLGHACGALDTCAAGLGAPFIGQRLYWLAATDDARLEGHRLSGRVDAETGRQVAAGHCATAGTHDRLASTMRAGRSEGWPIAGNGSATGSSSSDRLAASDGSGPLSSALSGVHSGENGTRSRHGEPERPSEFDRLASTMRSGTGSAAGDGADRDDGASQRMAATYGGQPRHGELQSSGEHGEQPENSSDSADSGIPLHPVDYWRDAEWLLCRDPNGPRFRPVESSSLIMADVGSVGGTLASGSGARQTHFPLTEKNTYVNRLNEIRGAGNALNVAQASTFIECAMEYLAE